jgi:hypothetical protein
MTTHIIEANIPMPPAKGGPGRQAKWPFTEMKVGESVLVPGQSCNTVHCPGYNAAKQIAHRTGAKFTGRAQGDGTVRIWRTA